MSHLADSPNTPLRSEHARRKLVTYLGRRSEAYFSARDLAAHRVRMRRIRIVMAALVVLAVGLAGAWRECGGGF